MLTKFTDAYTLTKFTDAYQQDYDYELLNPK